MYCSISLILSPVYCMSSNTLSGMSDNGLNRHGVSAAVMYFQVDILLSNVLLYTSVVSQFQ